MEIFARLGIAIPLALALVAVTIFFIFRAYAGRPVNKAEEQIFTLGIALGGIAMFVGLGNVGVGNFRESLSIVVEHLVGAVGINVVAMFCKMAYTYCSNQQSVLQRTGEVVSLDDLAMVLKENQKSQDQNTSKLVTAMESNQTKMDVNFRKLDITLNDFVKELGERLVTQIQHVIETLNEKLTEQLGDNFKRLNDAVNNLVLWQINYKEQLEHWQKVNKESAVELEKSAAALVMAAKNTQTFSESANRLEELARKIDRDYELLLSAQQQMELSLKALEGVPKIATEKLNEMISTLSSGARDMRSSGEQLTDTVKLNSTRVADYSKDLGEEIKRSQRDVGVALEKSTQDFSHSVDRQAQELFAKLNLSTREMDAHLRQGSTNVEVAIRQSSEKLYRELENSQRDYSQKLTESVTRMSDQLYVVEQSVEKALDEALREFAKKVTDICIYAVQTSQSAYGTATEVREEVRSGRI